MKIGNNSEISVRRNYHHEEKESH